MPAYYVVHRQATVPHNDPGPCNAVVVALATPVDAGFFGHKELVRPGPALYCFSTACSLFSRSAPDAGNRCEP